jgi:hypothetical protein
MTPLDRVILLIAGLLLIIVGFEILDRIQCHPAQPLPGADPSTCPLSRPPACPLPPWVWWLVRSPITPRTASVC